MATSINIIITDDKSQYRDIIRGIVSPAGINVLADAGNGQELLDLLSSLKPDVILLDLEMPVLDGNKTFSIIRDKFPDMAVIILSMYYESVLVEDYTQRGARGYLPKDMIINNEKILIEAINKVNAGGTFFFDVNREPNTYTNKQKELMCLIFDGKTNEEIAREKGVTTRAVEKQRQKIYKENGFDKPMDFYKYAFSKGLQYLGRR